MDSVTLGSVVDGIQKVGFPVMVAGAALWVCWKLALRQLDRQETQLEKLGQAHAEERKADREAHLGLLRELGGRLEQHGQTLGVIGENVRELVRRRVGGE